MTQAATSTPLVSCLCVTEGRPEFMPWLLWNFEKQTHARRELVVIDSSPQPLVSESEWESRVRVIHAPPGTSVPVKRNLALQSATGDLVAWFDDDDWQHPERLALLIEALGSTAGLAGCRHSWFLDLWADRCAEYRTRSGVIFNGALFSREVALSARFDPKRKRGSDTVWMQEILRRSSSSPALTREAPLSLWLCHERNLSNPRHRRRFSGRLEEVRDRISAHAWCDTDLELDRLRRRLRPANTPHVSLPSAVPSTRAHAPSQTDAGGVSVAIKATVLDAPYLQVMIPHMISQMRHPLADRCVVVDGRNDFSGKYAARPRASRADLDRELDALVQRGVIDRYVEVDYDGHRVAQTMERYFGPAGVRVPTHAWTGGPVYPTLFALEQAATDHVIQMDADMFFHADGVSWVAAGLEQLCADERTWLVMTQAGPPGGPMGSRESLGLANGRRAEWNAERRVWTFKSASTRYFLTDRRRLHGRLRPGSGQRGFLPLEQCIGLSLRAEGACRVNLALEGSWDLHAHSHLEPFPSWAADIARCVEAGRFPRMQAGVYDLRLDNAPARHAWGELVRSSGSQSSVPARIPTTPLVVGTNRDSLPVSVIIPIRDRAGERVANALASLGWQEPSPPAEIVVVSHGSDAGIDAELEELCTRYGARLARIGRPADPWCKPLALNHGIRTSNVRLSHVMTMDADMILAPNLLGTALGLALGSPKAFILCESLDLPQRARVPEDTEQLRRGFVDLRKVARRRGRHGTGGIQLAARQFFFEVRGYDEDLVWWGAEDGDMVRRARDTGCNIVWIDDRTSMLHQWHPKRHAVLADPARRASAAAAWLHNHALVKSKRDIVRNPDAWGGSP